MSGNQSCFCLKSWLELFFEKLERMFLDFIESRLGEVQIKKNGIIPFLFYCCLLFIVFFFIVNFICVSL